MRQISNILVTGGAGFMGSAFIRYLLLEEDFSGKIVNLDLLSYAANLQNLKAVEDRSNYFFHKGDICDQELVLEILEKYDIDCIAHFAAETHVDRSISSPYPFIRSNVEGTFSLLEQVRKQKTFLHFHHISTDEVYGSLGKEGFFTEESVYRPNSPYSASKAASDHLVRSYHKTYSISTTISHSVNNYGPFQYPEKLIPLMIKNCLEKKPLPIYGKGENVRDWIYVDDHASAVWKIIQHGQSNQVYDISASCEISNLELVHKIIDLLSMKMQKPKENFLSLIEYVKDRLGHDYRYAVDAKKLSNLCQWRPKYDLTNGLIKTIDHYCSLSQITDAAIMQSN